MDEAEELADENIFDGEFDDEFTNFAHSTLYLDAFDSQNVQKQQIECNLQQVKVESNLELEEVQAVSNLELCEQVPVEANLAAEHKVVQCNLKSIYPRSETDLTNELTGNFYLNTLQEIKLKQNKMRKKYNVKQINKSDNSSDLPPDSLKINKNIIINKSDNFEDPPSVDPPSVSKQNVTPINKQLKIGSATQLVEIVTVSYTHLTLPTTPYV